MYDAEPSRCQRRSEGEQRKDRPVSRAPVAIGAIETPAETTAPAAFCTTIVWPRENWEIVSMFALRLAMIFVIPWTIPTWFPSPEEN
jgi:hypothetical protein